ncbi:MAG: adenylate kinase [Candidatus Dojkabacteria bacterium]
MKTYMFHGPSGCGKDTQLDLLASKLDFERIAGGTMFREMLESADPYEKEIALQVKAGVFPNGDVFYPLLSKYVKKFDPNKAWVLVSTVRLENQLPYFEQFMKENNRTLDAFIHFTLSEEAAVERLALRSFCPTCSATYHDKYKSEKVKGICDQDGTKLERRSDDTPEAIKLRLKQYKDNIEPILEYFRNKGVLIEIDAAPSIEMIQKTVLEKLNLV